MGVVSDHRHVPPALSPGKTQYPLYIRLGGPPRASVNGRGKYGPPPGFDPRIVQPVASGYTDLAIPAHRNAVYEVYILMLRSSVWVEASRTSRKLAGLIPGGVMGIFH